MPPKKVETEEKLGPWALGRFTSNLKVRREPPRIEPPQIARQPTDRSYNSSLLYTSDAADQ